MIKNIDVDWNKFQEYHDKIENNLPKGYTFGYIGNIWGKWASDDRHFYIEDSKGNKITNYFAINHIEKLWYALEKHLVI